MSRKVFKIIIVVIALILVLLNINKYREMDDIVVPVWSSYDEEYYRNENLAFVDKVKNSLNFERFIYGMTKVRLRAPITYLNREIPLLAFYTPEELKTQTETLYTPINKGDNLIRLKFNLSDNKNNIPGTIGEDITGKNEVIEVPARPNFSDEQPLVAIYHTHTSETYMDDPRKQDSNGHVLPGNIGNVGRVGIELARVLSEKYGFRVIHTTRIHDESYNRSYYNSRNTVKHLLNESPEIDLILDIHRDGIQANATRNNITTVFDNERVANVMIVVANGKYTYGEIQELDSNWQDNLAIAKRLSAKMDQLYPGLLRRIEERDTTTNRYNQDLSPNSLLIEIGDYRNTTQEALKAARCVADSIAAMFELR